MHFLKTDKKLQALRKGYLAEYVTRMWFWCKGYRLLKHRWKHLNGEIDLIFKKKNHLIFVEVKYRKDNIQLEFSLSAGQYQRILKSIVYFQKKYPYYNHYGIRFDVVWFSSNALPVHHKNVW